MTTNVAGVVGNFLVFIISAIMGDRSNIAITYPGLAASLNANVLEAIKMVLKIINQKAWPDAMGAFNC